MNSKNVFLVFFIIMFSNLHAQVYGELSGNVTDETGQPILGASVFLEGTEKGAQTDFDGNYRITNIDI